MNIEYHKWWSPNLDQDMELKVYGHAGKPVVVFPTSGGRFYQYEDFGMVEACRPFIDEGRVQLFTVDSVDYQSWLNHGAYPPDRARRHSEYEQYITGEVLPFIAGREPDAGKLMGNGCSLGAYHSANILFRHPDLFDSIIALSGLYSLKFSVGDYMDDSVYYHSPLNYLPGLNDPWYLGRFRESRLIVCAGQGAGGGHTGGNIRAEAHPGGQKGALQGGFLGPRRKPRLALVEEADALFFGGDGVCE